MIFSGRVNLLSVQPMLKDLQNGTDLSTRRRQHAVSLSLTSLTVAANQVSLLHEQAHFKFSDADIVSLTSLGFLDASAEIYMSTQSGFILDEFGNSAIPIPSSTAQKARFVTARPEVAASNSEASGTFSTTLILIFTFCSLAFLVLVLFLVIWIKRKRDARRGLKAGSLDWDVSVNSMAFTRRLNLSLDWDAEDHTQHGLKKHKREQKDLGLDWDASEQSDRDKISSLDCDAADQTHRDKLPSLDWDADDHASHDAKKSQKGNSKRLILDQKEDHSKLDKPKARIAPVLKLASSPKLRGRHRASIEEIDYDHLLEWDTSLDVMPESQVRLI
jgi:hypothetical protein